MVILGWSLNENPTYRAFVGDPFGAFADSILRGVGQVMFQNNPLTGLIFLIGIFYNSWLFGLYAILATAVSTLTAIALGAPTPLVRAGIFGFNGTLLGIAFAFFLQSDPMLALYVIAGAIGASVVLAALLNLLSTWDVPPLTAPFVFTTWFFLFAFYLFSSLQNTVFLGAPTLPTPITTPGSISVETFYVGFFKGVGQVFFQDNFITGLIFLFAIFVNSRISTFFAGLGSLMALLTALSLGAAEPTVRSGLYGFNAVLTGIALGGVFYVITWRSGLYALFGIIASAIVFAALAVALTPIGMPTLTGPFVLTTWFFIFAKPLFGQLHAVPLDKVATPEDNLQWYRKEQRRQAEEVTEERRKAA